MHFKCYQDEDYSKYATTVNTGSVFNIKIVPLKYIILPRNYCFLHFLVFLDLVLINLHLYCLRHQKVFSKSRLSHMITETQIRPLYLHDAVFIPGTHAVFSLDQLLRNILDDGNLQKKYSSMVPYFYLTMILCIVNPHRFPSVIYSYRLSILHDMNLVYWKKTGKGGGCGSAQNEKQFQISL